MTYPLAVPRFLYEVINSLCDREGRMEKLGALGHGKEQTDNIVNIDNCQFNTYIFISYESYVLFHKNAFSHLLPFSFSLQCTSAKNIYD